MVGRYLLVWALSLSMLYSQWGWNQQQDPFLYSSLYIVGDFHGWQGNTVVELSDGTFWIQEGYRYQYCLCINPRVVLDGGYMWVEDCNEQEGVRVRQLRNARKLTVREVVTQHGEKVMVLSDGSAWATYGDIIWDYWVGEECLLFDDGGWKCRIDGKVIALRPAQLSSGSGNTPQAPLTPLPAQGTILRLENATSMVLYASFAWFVGANGWQAQGWFKLDPHQSIDLPLGNYVGTVYIYAEDSNHQYEWANPQSSFTFCVHRVQAFTIPHADVDRCNSSEYKRVRGSAYRVVPGINKWTFLP